MHNVLPSAVRILCVCRLAPTTSSCSFSGGSSGSSSRRCRGGRGSLCLEFEQGFLDLRQLQFLLSYLCIIIHHQPQRCCLLRLFRNVVAVCCAHPGTHSSVDGALYCGAVAGVDIGAPYPLSDEFVSVCAPLWLHSSILRQRGSHIVCCIMCSECWSDCSTLRDCCSSCRPYCSSRHRCGGNRSSRYYTSLTQFSCQVKMRYHLRCS